MSVVGILYINASIGYGVEEVYGSAVAVGAIGRAFLRVDRVERLQQRPIAKIVWIRRKRKRTE